MAPVRGLGTPVNATGQWARSPGRSVLLLAPGRVWDPRRWLVPGYFQCSTDVALWSRPSQSQQRELLFSSGWKSPRNLHAATKQTWITAIWDYPSFSCTNSSQHIHSVTMGTWASQSQGTTPAAVPESVFPVPVFLASHGILGLIFGKQVPYS